jgi:hypothetical protein
MEQMALKLRYDARTPARTQGDYRDWPQICDWTNQLPMNRAGTWDVTAAQRSAWPSASVFESGGTARLHSGYRLTGAPCFCCCGICLSAVPTREVERGATLLEDDFSQPYNWTTAPRMASRSVKAGAYEMRLT